MPNRLAPSSHPCLLVAVMLVLLCQFTVAALRHSTYMSSFSNRLRTAAAAAVAVAAELAGTM